MLLYVTSDKIGDQTGGGIVTAHELEALQTLGPVDVINTQSTLDPFMSEKNIQISDFSKYKLAHFYAGTCPELVKKLKENGVKVTYTVAAHDVDLSREEFQNLGMSFNFAHLNDPILFDKYVGGYRDADVVISPSTAAEKINKKYGCKSTTVIPHGCHLMSSKAPPKVFNVGYLGQIGPDKGLRYLIEAWAMLNYKDSILNLAGRHTPELIGLLRHFNKGNTIVWGWVKSVEDFYNACSIYVQPSVTEGFGIEVLEAISCNRPVIVSDGAGAADCVGNCGFVFEKRNVKQLADYIDKLKKENDLRNEMSKNCRQQVQKYTWDVVKQQYISLWKGMLN